MGFSLDYAAKHDKNMSVPLGLMIPIVLFVCHSTPLSMLKLHCIVSSIGLMKDPHAIDQTIREVKFAKSIRTIKILRSLQTMVKMNTKSKPEETRKDDDTEIESAELTDEEILRKQELKDVFD